MSPAPPRLFPCVLAGALALVAAQASAQVTVYRCQGSNGNITLSDAPCPDDQRQQVRQMLRPQDPPPAPTPPAPPPAPPPAAPIVREVVIYRTPPRPMYECTTEEGKSYTSDSGDGNPRLVPIWSLGYHGRGAVAIGNTWVRDACHQLPQAEVCDRLRDRRYQIQRQYHSALQSERHALDQEQRGLDARLGNDCGAE